jgi:excisionase family DNA binding protein
MVYTVEEISKLLKVSVATVRRLIRIGELEAFPVGNQYRVTQEALDKYMKRKASQ